MDESWKTGGENGSDTASMPLPSQKPGISDEYRMLTPSEIAFLLQSQIEDHKRLDELLAK